MENEDADGFPLFRRSRKRERRREEILLDAEEECPSFRDTGLPVSGSEEIGRENRFRLIPHPENRGERGEAE